MQIDKFRWVKYPSKPPRNGREIQAARALLGWTQDDLAQHSGLHTKSVSYWERHGVRPVGGIAVRDMVLAFRDHGLVFINGGVALMTNDDIADG
ncbi:MAG: helix-turn-helix transcriptional regulator [Pseudomonadota bacterium]